MMNYKKKIKLIKAENIQSLEDQINQWFDERPKAKVLQQQIINECTCAITYLDTDKERHTPCSLYKNGKTIIVEIPDHAYEQNKNIVIKQDHVFKFWVFTRQYEQVYSYQEQQGLSENDYQFIPSKQEMIELKEMMKNPIAEPIVPPCTSIAEAAYIETRSWELAEAIYAIIDYILPKVDGKRLSEAILISDHKSLAKDVVTYIETRSWEPCNYQTSKTFEIVYEIIHNANIEEVQKELSKIIKEIEKEERPAEYVVVTSQCVRSSFNQYKNSILSLHENVEVDVWARNRLEKIPLNKLNERATLRNIYNWYGTNLYLNWLEENKQNWKLQELEFYTLLNNTFHECEMQTHSPETVRASLKIQYPQIDDILIDSFILWKQKEQKLGNLYKCSVDQAMDFLETEKNLNFESMTYKQFKNCLLKFLVEDDGSKVEDLWAFPETTKKRVFMAAAKLFNQMDEHTFQTRKKLLDAYTLLDDTYHNCHMQQSVPATSTNEVVWKKFLKDKHPQIDDDTLDLFLGWKRRQENILDHYYKSYQTNYYHLHKMSSFDETMDCLNDCLKDKKLNLDMTYKQFKSYLLKLLVEDSFSKEKVFMAAAKLFQMSEHTWKLLPEIRKSEKDLQRREKSRDIIQEYMKVGRRTANTIRQHISKNMPNDTKIYLEEDGVLPGDYQIKTLGDLKLMMFNGTKTSDYFLTSSKETLSVGQLYNSLMSYLHGDSECLDQIEKQIISELTPLKAVSIACRINPEMAAKLINAVKLEHKQFQTTCDTFVVKEILDKIDDCKNQFYSKSKRLMLAKEIQHNVVDAIKLNLAVIPGMAFVPMGNKHPLFHDNWNYLKTRGYTGEPSTSFGIYPGYIP